MTSRQWLMLARLMIRNDLLCLPYWRDCTDRTLPSFGTLGWMRCRHVSGVDCGVRGGWWNGGGKWERFEHTSSSSCTHSTLSPAQALFLYNEDRYISGKASRSSSIWSRLATIHLTSKNRCPLPYKTPRANVRLEPRPQTMRHQPMLPLRRRLPPSQHVHRVRPPPPQDGRTRHPTLR